MFFKLKKKKKNSVKTERKGRDAVSWLLMARANSRDSGIYTCSVDNRSEAIVSVHVIQGEKTRHIIVYFINLNIIRAVELNLFFRFFLDDQVNNRRPFKN